MNRHRFRKKAPLAATLLAFAALVATYVFGLAWIQSRIYKYYDFADLVVPRLIDAIIVIWLIYFCSSIGSFLNVVAWRMPRGESIGGRSHCPRCANTLQSRDNVPILGWISLGGRCRFCSLPISSRYPIVESLVGITLTLIGIWELYSLSLPNQFVHWHGGPIWSPRVSSVLLAILTYHAVAVATLWGMALIRIDGTGLPAKLIAFAAVAVAIPLLAFPTLMVVPWQTTRPSDWYPDGLYVDAVMRVLTALVAAAFAGRVLAKGLCPSADLKLDPLGTSSKKLVDLIAMLCIPALVIGWQSMPALVIVTALLSWPLRPLLSKIEINSGPRGSVTTRGALEQFSFALPFALTLHLMFWRRLWEFDYWPSDHSSPSVIVTWSLLMLTVPMFLKEGPPKERPVTDNPFQDDLIPPDAVPQRDGGALSGSDSADELPQQEGEREPDDGNQGRDHAPGA